MNKCELDKTLSYPRWTRRELHQVVKALIEQGRGEEISSVLAGRYHVCVVREWANQVKVIKHLTERAAIRKQRKEASPVGGKWDWSRRILYARPNFRTGRIEEFHATKGPRSYRIPG